MVSFKQFRGERLVRKQEAYFNFHSLDLLGELGDTSSQDELKEPFHIYDIFRGLEAFAQRVYQVAPSLDTDALDVVGRLIGHGL